jgi:hypothetical protein
MTQLPNFLYIGPDKCGSTWIHRVLSGHPDVFFPVVKDIYFFDKNYHRGRDWYLSFFKNAKTEKIRGEVSHDYLYSKDAMRRIHRDLPDVRLMVCLREPVERAFSAYLYLIKHGMTRSDFSEAIGRFPHLLEQSQYAKYLGPYLERFGKHKMLIGVFDELQDNPEAFADKMFKFLDIQRIVLSKEMYENCFPASRPRNAALACSSRAAPACAERWGFCVLLATPRPPDGYLHCCMSLMIGMPVRRRTKRCVCVSKSVSVGMLRHWTL